MSSPSLRRVQSVADLSSPTQSSVLRGTPPPPPSDIFDADELLERLDDICKNIQDPFPTADPIQYLTIDDRLFNPDGKMDTDKAIIMRSAFKNMGRASSLARVLSDISKKKPPRKIWAHMQGGNQPVMMNVINTMWHGMVEGLIDGDLAYRYCNEDDFCRGIQAHHSLIKSPGNYVQAMARSRTVFNVGNTQETYEAARPKNENAGRWLTPEEILLYHKTGLEYLVNPKLAQEVDVVYQGLDKKMQPASYGQPLNWRRYAGNAAQRTKVEEYLKAIDKNYVRRINLMQPGDPRWKIALRYGPLEIGYGKDLMARVGQHDHHPDSNYLFTFHQALMTYLFDRDRVEFEIFRFTVCRVPVAPEYANDPRPYQAANTIDVGVTMLAGSHWFDGGLNPDFGAGGGVNEKKLLDEWKFLQETHEEIYKHGTVFRSNLRKDEKAIEDWKEREKIMANIDDTQRDQEQQRKEFMEEKAKLILELQDLKQAQDRVKLDKKIAKIKEPELSRKQGKMPAASSPFATPARSLGGPGSATVIQGRGGQPAILSSSPWGPLSSPGPMGPPAPPRRRSSQGGSSKSGDQT